MEDSVDWFWFVLNCLRTVRGRLVISGDAVDWEPAAELGKVKGFDDDDQPAERSLILD